MRVPGLPQEPGRARIPITSNTRAVAQAGSSGDDWMCLDCGRPFASKIGLGVHRRRAHPITVNAEAAPAQDKRRWREEEVALMAKTEARLTLSGSRFLNQDLLRELPNFGRSLEAIKGQRKGERYKNLVREYLVRMSGKADSTEISSRGDVPVDATTTGPTPACQADNLSPLAPGSRSVGDGAEASAEVSGPMTLPETSPAPETPIVVCPPSEPTLSVADQNKILSGLFQKAETRKSQCLGGRRHVQSKRASTLERRVAAQSAISARKRRRMEYARVQEMYRKCPGRAAAEIIDGGCRGVRHSLGEMDAYWRPIFEAVSNAPGPRTETLRALKREGKYGSTSDASQLWAPFSVQEVKASRVDGRSAPGPDGILPGDWNTLSAETQTALFNVWMANGEIPERLRQSRTIFVPKTDMPTCPGEYRPISISSVPLRHMHSALARRLESLCLLDARQRGFICVDGTLENSAVLDAVLGDCKQSLRECHVAVLDFAKAFDTVSHAALVKVLRERGLPVGFCNYIAKLYEAAETVLVVDGVSSVPAKVGQGVRQGDPLSPLLFNLALDVVLYSLPKEVGYRLEGEKVSALAYADDLVLLAGSVVGMQAAIDSVVESGQTMGLFVSHAKSAVLSMVPDGKRKKQHYLTARTFRVGRRWVKQVSCVERWRYLGVDFKAAGCVTLEHDLKQALTNITKAPLKPQQRLEILRVHLVPRFLHGFVLGNISDARLRLFDVQIRSAVRDWLRLPKDVPVGYFHAATKDGGLAIPSVRTLVPALVHKRFGRLESSGWSAAKAAAKSTKIRRKLAWADKQLRKLTRENPSTGERTTDLYWREKLHTSVDGFELRESSAISTSTGWIRGRGGQFSGRDFVQAVHTHINALPSRVRNSRGRRTAESELNCRAGCAVRETTAHAIQQCHRTHGGRILRHNKVADMISSVMEREGWTVIKEPKIKTGLGLRKPDIIAARRGEGVIVDAQIVSGRRPLDDLHRDKSRKYGAHGELVKEVGRLLGLSGPKSVTATSCTVSWRGVWSPGSYKELKRLGISEETLLAIPTVVLRGSHMNWAQFNKSTVVARSGERGEY